MMMTYDIPKLLKMSQAQLDALFTASDAGPIPEGHADGTAIIASGAVFSPEIASFISYFSWQDKLFDRGSGTLRSRIEPFGLNAIIATVYKAPSWLDGKDCIVIDYCKTSEVAHWSRDEIRLIQGLGLYLGKVYRDKSH